MRDSLRHFVAEFVGTFALVFIGGGAIMSAELAKNPAGITQIALAHGLILAVMVSSLMRISGSCSRRISTWDRRCPREARFNRSFSSS